MHLIDTVLLILLPLAFAAKTAGFGGMAIVMAGQEARHPLGRYLLRLFWSLTATSAMLTVLFTVFAIRWHDADLSRWVLLMAPLSAFVVLTAYYGVRVWQAHDDADHADHADHADDAQEAT